MAAPVLAVLIGSLTAWDRAAFLAMNRWVASVASPWLDDLMNHGTDLGLGGWQAFAVLAVAVALGAWRGEVRWARLPRDVVRAIHRRRWWVGPLLVALTFTLSSDVIKGLAPVRSRPWWFYEEQHKAGRYLDVHVRTVPGVNPLMGHGFPSGHTTSSFAVAATLTMLLWRRRSGRWLLPLAWVLGAFVGLSRIYLASHWPIDVLGGMLLGALCGVAGLVTCRAWARSNAPPAGAGQPDRAEDAPV